MDFIGELDRAILAGVALTLLVPLFVERLKIWFPKFFDPVPIRAKYAALLVGTALGSVYLIIKFPVAAEPDVFFAIFARVGSAFAWSFMAPWFYDFQKLTAAKGVAEHNEEVEAVLVMGGTVVELDPDTYIPPPGIPPADPMNLE